MAPMNLSPLCAHMDSLSRWTWARVVDAHSLDSRFGEIALTESLLFELRWFGENNPLDFDIVIEQVSQQTEARTGADFEIWLEVETNKYFAYSIQAKRVKLPRLAYPSLGQPGHPNTKPGIAADPGKPLQYDTLLAHAEKYGTNAVHLFYNGWSAPEGVFRAPEQKVFGCAVIPTGDLKAIREARAQRTNMVRSFAPYVRPWSALFQWPWYLHPYYGPWNNPWIDDGYYIDAIETEEWHSRAEMAMTENPDIDPSAFYPELVELPGYVRHAQEGGSIPDDSALPRFAVIIRRNNTVRRRLRG